MKHPKKLKLQHEFDTDPSFLMDSKDPEDATEFAQVPAGKVAFARELMKRYNAYGGMLMELKESLKDLTNWDGTPEAMEIIKENIADRIKKAKRGAIN